MSFFFDTKQPFKDPNDRIDAKVKVTGAAKYSADFHFDNLAYGVLVQSTITKGNIEKIDIKAAKSAAGVIDIITHNHHPKVYGFAKEKRVKKFRLGYQLFHDEEIYFNGQPIALVIADKLEQAQYAASLIKVTYKKETHLTDFEGNINNAKSYKHPWSPDANRGDINKMSEATHKISSQFNIATEVHSPMEPHATIAMWEGDDKITIYDKTHAIKGAQRAIANAFHVPAENVIINSEFVGGGFGAGLRVWAHTFAAIMAAKITKRPVKVTLTRPQMFGLTGYRPQSFQDVTIGADNNGKLIAINHKTVAQSPDYDVFAEGISGITKMFYACPNLMTSTNLVYLDVSAPLWMRAPGEVTGAFALETAMDELAEKVGIDPIELRLRNFAEMHPDNDKPWSTNFLKECYEKGANRFGWEQRKATPRSNRQGDFWVGHGMALGSWGAWRNPSSCFARFTPDGKLLLQASASDMGPGTATAMVKIAENAFGIDASKIKFELGKSTYADAPGQGGSVTVSSVGSAVQDACDELKKQLLALANEQKIFNEAKMLDVVFTEGKITLKTDEKTQVAYSQLLTQKNMKQLEVTASSRSGGEQEKFAFQSFAAHFAEVHVHAITGVIKVSRYVACVDAGAIISPKTAASQISGAVVMGIGMALMEEMRYDNRYGRIVGGDFANYHVPTHADVPNIEVEFINKPDYNLNKMGSKGLGEVGIIGCAAAIGNAIYNATGTRVKDLPFLIEQRIS